MPGVLLHSCQIKFLTSLHSKNFLILILFHWHNAHTKSLRFWVKPTQTDDFASLAYDFTLNPKSERALLPCEGFYRFGFYNGYLTGCILKMVGILSGFRGDVTVTFWNIVIFYSHDPSFKVPHRITLNVSRFNFKSILSNL